MAFGQCSNLTNIELLACTSIGSNVFYDCDKLESVILRTPEVAELSSSSSFPQTTKIYVPANLLESYKTAKIWREIANQIFPIYTVLPGDVNQDGKVSIGDITAMVEILQGRDNVEPYKYSHLAADLDEDGSITLADLAALRDIILMR